MLLHLQCICLTLGMKNVLVCKNLGMVPHMILPLRANHCEVLPHHAWLNQKLSAIMFSMQDSASHELLSDADLDCLEEHVWRVVGRQVCAVDKPVCKGPMSRLQLVCNRHERVCCNQPFLPHISRSSLDARPQRSRHCPFDDIDLGQ